MRRPAAIPVLVGAALSLALVACTTDAGDRSSATTRAPRSDRAAGELDAARSAAEASGWMPSRIVQLGDSIASGEGTLYGYSYDADSQWWTGGNLDAAWPGPYPDCHTSPAAYGNLVAAAYGAAFTQFACTGASFDDGIATERASEGTVYRPAEFGNWERRTELNAAYDAANPDLVLITLGADDVDFSGIVTDCVENAYEHYWVDTALECTEQSPGASVQELFVDRLPAVAAHYGQLVDWIGERARANGVPVPRIVFTNYPDPLPDPKVRCPDARMLYDPQVRYLASLLDEMNDLISTTIERLDEDHVVVADVSEAYRPPNDDHRWCSPDPWAYGLSIYQFTSPSSFRSLAPFHPTPEGQQAIAAGVLATITHAFGVTHPARAARPAPG
jgi:lysophospholipase L1-like esterase